MGDMKGYEEQVQLSVRESSIERPGGARINAGVFRQLGLSETDNKIDVAFNNVSIVRKAFPDESVNRQEIFLRRDARDALSIEEKDIVTVSRHRTIGEAAKERLGRFSKKEQPYAKESISEEV